jgi:fido (protein-threonine AMPylation protein)
MTTPSEKLAESLKELKKIQNEDRITAIKANRISRTHRERLLENGFIQEVIKGWYISSRPGEKPGDTTSWYTSFWQFCSDYLNDRFSDDWCLSPELSISLHSGNWTVPEQLLVRSTRASNNLTNLLHGTSLLEVCLAIPAKKEIVKKNGLNIYSLPTALIACSEAFYTQSPNDVRASLLTIKDSSELLSPLLDGGRTLVAGRLAGALRNIDRPKMADEIINIMRSAGYDVREKDPFSNKLPIISSSQVVSPIVFRIKIMWQQMRNIVIEHFPNEPGLSKNISAYLKNVEDIYMTDAYNSLSIEGYKVSSELIEKVRSGNWNPGTNKEDEEYKNALAARGYWQAFQYVKESIRKILNGQNSGSVLRSDHSFWYRELFTPGVAAGILKASDLAGYRNIQVYIKQSRYIPPDPASVRDAMPALFELLESESNSAVRCVLGHFIFVYIHPYPDGNGRIARFLMNAMLASGGYLWTVIPIENRNSYMKALEKASIEQDIKDLIVFIAQLVKEGLQKQKPDKA